MVARAPARAALTSEIEYLRNDSIHSVSVNTPRVSFRGYDEDVDDEDFFETLEI